MCGYTCVYIYIYIYMYVSIFNACVYICMCVYIYLCMCMFLYICISIYLYISISVYISMCLVSVYVVHPYSSTDTTTALIKTVFYIIG